VTYPFAMLFMQHWEYLDDEKQDSIFILWLNRVRFRPPLNRLLCQGNHERGTMDL
jgi:hypothetical protein